MNRLLIAAALLLTVGCASNPCCERLNQHRVWLANYQEEYEERAQRHTESIEGFERDVAQRIRDHDALMARAAVRSRCE